jgi:DNA repair photolyase
MSDVRCQCGRFAYCIPKLCRMKLKIKQRGSDDRRIGRFGHLIATDQQTGSIIQTEVSEINARSIISTNQSPDIPWSQTINPYQGCEHGCIYCYARPSHAYHGLSPALDFETKLFAKINAPQLLRDRLSKTSYRPSTIGLGTNTDCYQPIERRYEITRGLLTVLREFKHPVSILTKNTLIERDIDILSTLAEDNLVEVHFTVTTLNTQLARQLEPRASLPQRRLETIEKLAQHGIPVKVMISPLIPGLNEEEIEAIMHSAKLAGAIGAGYILLRLPHEVEGLFTDWLQRYYPEQKQAILDGIAMCRPSHGRQDYFATRMQGSGAVAASVQARFLSLFTQLEFKNISPDDLDSTQFTRYFGAIQRELF